MRATKDRTMVHLPQGPRVRMSDPATSSANRDVASIRYGALICSESERPAYEIVSPAPKLAVPASHGSCTAEHGRPGPCQECRVMKVVLCCLRRCVAVSATGGPFRWASHG